jgi:hypothetical protein
MSNEARLDELAASVRRMDELSQEGFEQIQDLARVALRVMETAPYSRDLAPLKSVLLCIRDKAEDIGNLINAEAEDRGCNHVQAPHPGGQVVGMHG